MHRTYPVLAFGALLLALSGTSAHAQRAEVGGWLARNYSSESTRGAFLCPDDGSRCAAAGWSPAGGRRATAGALALRLPIGDLFALRGETALIPKGYARSTDSFVSSLYLELPLLAEVSSRGSDRISLFLAAGVAPAVLLKCSLSSETAAGAQQSPCGTAGYGAEELGTRRFDLGSVFSGGLRVHTVHGAFYLEARTVGGLIDTRPGNAGRTLNSTSALMAGFSVLAPARW